jgi:hypothetical protein
MPGAARDAFGRLLADPAALTLAQRVELLRGLAGRLMADSDRGAAWFGQTLQGWLTDGGDLCAALGVKPARGSRATAQTLIRRERADRLLLRLAAECGSDAAALAALNGGPCKPAARRQVAELLTLRCPKSEAAIRRARARLRDT